MKMWLKINYFGVAFVDVDAQRLFSVEALFQVLKLFYHSTNW